MCFNFLVKPNVTNQSCIKPVVCTYNLYIKFPGTLIVHKTPSEFAPYEFKLCFTPYIFMHKSSSKWFWKTALLYCTFQNNVREVSRCHKFSGHFRTVHFFDTPCIAIVFHSVTLSNSTLYRLFKYHNHIDIYDHSLNNVN